ncbi:unnamed protein product, partial [Staurois parvus]
MDTDRWHCWGYTDQQGTLIISALRRSPRCALSEPRMHSEIGRTSYD